MLYSRRQRKWFISIQLLLSLSHLLSRSGKEFMFEAIDILKGVSSKAFAVMVIMLTMVRLGSWIRGIVVLEAFAIHWRASTLLTVFSALTYSFPVPIQSPSDRCLYSRAF